MSGLQNLPQKYRIIEKIEETNYAVIYRVQDPDDNSIVLKIARQKSNECNELISREFQVLSQFNHPNIVTVFDYDVTDDNRAYFTLDYIPGKPINQIFQIFSEDFVKAIIQVINALGAFHNKGFIHTDLKPEHILYNPKNKKVVLIDFGFVQLYLVETGISAQGTKPAGTIGYIAPEVLKGIGMDQRSDLYSLGVIIYEIAAGKKPTETYAPIKGLSQEVNTTIARLLSREPAIRPTIPELYQIFIKYLSKTKVEIPAYEVKLPPTGFVEIPEITQRLSRAKAEAIILSGDVGSGKTRLLKELKFKFLSQGYLVLFYIGRENIDFHQALCNFINYKFSFSNKEERFQIYEEILENLINFSKDKKIVVMVDDLEDLNDYELGLFRYIGYGLANSQILLMGAGKFDERIKDLGFETLNLKPFSISEIEQLLEKTFFSLLSAGQDTGVGNEPKLDAKTSFADFTQWLYHQSGGNPLFIVETLISLYERKVIYYQAENWRIAMELLKEIKIPSKLEDLLGTRVKNLNPKELDLLKILSLVGCPLEPVIINEISPAISNINIEHLKNFGLLRDEHFNNKRMVVLPNQILGFIVERGINQEERFSLYNKIIDAVETISPEDKNYFPILGRLYDKTGNTEKAYKYLQVSAEDAEAIYDYHSALDYYKKLGEYSKNMHPEKYFEFFLKIGDLSQIIGNNKLAIEYYNEALKTTNKKLLSRVYFGLGKVCSTMGEYNQAVKHFDNAIEIIDQKTNEYIKTANLKGYILIYLSKFEEAEKIFDNSVLLSKKSKDQELEAETLYYQATLEWFRNNFEKGIENAKKLLNFCEKHKLFKQYAFCANLLSSFYLQKGDIENGIKYIDLAIEEFNKLKQVDALCAAAGNKALLSLSKGDITSARTIFEETLSRAKQTGNRSIQYVALSNLASIYENLSKFEQAIDYNKQSLEINPAGPDPTYYLSMIFNKKGEIDKAKQILEEKLKIKEEILYYIGLSMINMVLGKINLAEEYFNKGLKMVEAENPYISIKIETYLKATQFYYEKGDFENSLIFADKIKAMTPIQSREYRIADSFIKINNFRLKKTREIDIEQETKSLKDKGIIYDYAYLKKLRIESLIDEGINQDEIKKILEELNSIEEIFGSIGAELELNRVRKIKEKLFPIIVKDYTRRIISVQYLETFSFLAELISSNLGNEDFIQNILDLIIKTTEAERGALFIKTAGGMELVAGRNIDRTTIKDANELSQTAIDEINKNQIVFVQDAVNDPKFNIKKSVLLNQIRSLLCIPLAVSNNIIGAIYLDSRIAGGTFGPQDKDFLVTISKILASVIEKSIAFRALTEENILLKSSIIKDIGSGYLIGKSRPIKEVYKIIESVSKTISPVLITGETGTGKGMIARLIHLKSERKNKKFLSINCGTIAETLLESELFGHKRGSFTGAISDKKGLLEEAEGGIIFLDEITNTSPSFQAKLLEAIEEKTIRRVGETQTRNIDVRFLFATNKDLEIEVEEGRFRKDLFYRVNVFKIEVPALRERVKDIPLLARFFLDRYSKEINKKIAGFTPEAMERLKEYYWPGNVRELQNIIEKAVVLAKGSLITTEDLGFEKTKPGITSLKEIKKEAIIEALARTNWNIKKTAESLGIGRKSLYRYIKDYNINK